MWPLEGSKDSFATYNHAADSAQDTGRGLLMLISHPEIDLNLAQKQHLLCGLQKVWLVSMLKNIKYKDIELEVLNPSYLDR